MDEDYDDDLIVDSSNEDEEDYENVMNPDGSTIEIESLDGEADGLGEENSQVPADDSLHRLQFHSKDVFCLSISPSKRWLASGSEDDTAAIWELHGNLSSPQFFVTEHKDSVNCLSFDYQSNVLASGDMSGLIICTSLDDGNYFPIEDSGELEWIKWHPSTMVLLAGCADGIIWMWLISKDGLSVDRFKTLPTSSNSPCIDGKFLDAEKTLISIFGDGTVGVWNIRDSSYDSTRIPHHCSTMEVFSSRNVVAVGSLNGEAFLLQTPSLKILYNFTSSSTESRQSCPSKQTQSTDKQDASASSLSTTDNSVETLQFAPVDSGFFWLAVGTAAGDLFIYDCETGTIRHHCSHDGMSVVSVLWAYLPQSSHSSAQSSHSNAQSSFAPLYIMSACIDSAIRLWDGRTGEPVLLLSGGGAEIFSMVLSDRSLNILSTTFSSAESALSNIPLATSEHCRLKTSVVGQSFSFAVFTGCAGGLIRAFQIGLSPDRA